MTDLKFAFRQLLKHKGSSALAVLILALGIGGTTAVYSVADKALLHPIPGRDTDRLIAVQEVDLIHLGNWQSSPPVIEALSRQTNLIESVTYFFQSADSRKLRIGDKTSKLNGARVAPNFFDLFELRPLLGRTFLPTDGEDGESNVLIISYGFWKRQFGGEPSAVGKTLVLNDKIYTVVGVMPANAKFPYGAEYTQYWMPYRFTGNEINSDWAPMNRMWMATARLRKGVELAKVQAVLNVVAARRADSVNGPNQQWTIKATPMWETLSSEKLRSTLWILLAMLGALLLIACANVGNILLSRALSRHGEIGVRMAMGASRMHVAGLMLLESLVLAAASAGVGIFVAWGGIIALEQFYLTNLPAINVIGLDWQVLGMACLAAVVVGVLFGSAPAWVAARTNVNQTLKESTQRHSGGALQRMFHDGLVVVQVSVAVLLLAGASLMTRSAINILRIDPGVEANGLYRVFYDSADFLNSFRYDVKGAIERGVPEKQAIRDAWRARVDLYFTFRRTALERLRSIAGVQFAAVNNGPGFYDFHVEGRDEPLFLGNAPVGVVEGDYLRTIGAKLVSGRLLTMEDAQPGRPEVVINKKLAQLCWPGESPLGKRIDRADGKDRYLVVGVIENVYDYTFVGDMPPVFYEPYERDTKTLSGGVGDYMVRSSLAPEALRESVVQAGKELMAPLELYSFYSIKSQLYQSTAPMRVMMWLLLSLGGLGLLLSAMGLYAVLAYSVALRTREVGIRMAVGADRERIRSLFIRRGVRLIANGLVLGIVATISVGPYFRSLLFGVNPVDPWCLVSVIFLLGIVGGTACWVPAKRASLLDPMNALRNE